MPPQVRNGKPVNARRYVVPSKMVLCTCSECISYSHFDTDTRSFISGQFIPHRMYSQHLRADRDRRTISRHYKAQGKGASSSLDDKLGTSSVHHDPSSQSPVATEQSFYVKTEKSEPSSINSSRTKPLDQYKPRKLTSSPPQSHMQSQLLGKIKEYIRTLPSGSFRESVFQKKLDFRYPPHQHLDAEEPESHPEIFELEVDSANNYALLQHEKTLGEYLEVMKAIQTKRLASVLELARIKLLIPQVQDQIAEAFNIRKECWMKMREVSQVPERVEAGA